MFQKTSSRVILAVLFLGGAAGLALAGTCYQPTYYKPTYSYQNTYTPYKAPTYNAPAYNYGYGYNQPYYQPPSYYQPPYYYPVPATSFQFMPALSPAAAAPAAGATAAAPQPAAAPEPVRAKLLPEEEVRAKPKTKARASVGVTEGLVVAPDAPPDDADEGVATQERPQQSVMQQRCASCHTEGKEKGGLALFSRRGNPLTLTSEDKKSILEAITDRVMPPKNGGGPLSRTEVARLRAELGGKVARNSQPADSD